VGEEIACALTGALLWPFIGPFFLKDEDIGVGLGAYFAGLAGGPAVTFIGIIAAIETKGLTEDISKKLGSTCKKQDDENYECNDQLNLLMSLSPPVQSRLELSQAFGVPEGLVLSGFVRNLAERAPDSVTVTATPLQWTVSGTCRGGGFAIVNQSQINVVGSRDGVLGQVIVLADPLNEFMVTRKDGVVTIRPRFQPAYTNAPYPCRVRLVTTAGVRTITLAPPAAITEQEQAQLEVFRSNFTKTCQIWRDSFTEILEWKVERPGPVEKPNIEFWQFVVNGMRADDAIRVIHPEGETVMIGRPSRAGIAHLSLMFSGDQAPATLGLELIGQEDAGDRARNVLLQQVRFEHRATLPVGDLVREMRFEGNDRNRRLIVMDDDRELTWDVTVPVAPALLHTSAATENDRQVDAVIHTGKRVGTAATPRLRRAMERLRSRGGQPVAVASPRVGGIAETLYVQTRQHAKLFDISSPDEPLEVHDYKSPAWYTGVALGGSLMAKHDPDRNVVELYVATANESL
jgi:hypothetical protein